MVFVNKTLEQMLDEIGFSDPVKAALTEYDLNTGQLISSEDPNGLTEESDYDAFGRLVEVRRTDSKRNCLKMSPVVAPTALRKPIK